MTNHQILHSFFLNTIQFDSLKEEDSNGSEDSGHVTDVTSPVTSETDDGHKLPPCRVCGGRASGFHYGANTCEACKVC